MPVEMSKLASVLEGGKCSLGQKKCFAVQGGAAGPHLI